MNFISHLRLMIDKKAIFRPLSFCWFRMVGAWRMYGGNRLRAWMKHWSKIGDILVEALVENTPHMVDFQ